jgi:hypothetical protein
VLDEEEELAYDTEQAGMTKTAFTGSKKKQIVEEEEVSYLFVG